ncbi:hypothetical protein HMPREF9057_02099 [Actinomyces sp. oral taxon 171 str. F0337]|nr:hypothetical protein HMPREF9057_02099 [Actinomyces sp. oral taxon 171 str. F0337]
MSAATSSWHTVTDSLPTTHWHPPGFPADEDPRTTCAICVVTPRSHHLQSTDRVTRKVRERVTHAAIAGI